MKHLLPLLPLLALPLVNSGCAKSPASGGPVASNAHNRLTVVMKTQAPVDDANIYDFAFDDDDNPATGPAAIVGPTALTNGVVGGSFTVLVQYRAGQYTAFRRTAVSATAETLDRASRAFVVSPTPANGGSTLAFTLDLDAKTDSGVYLFRHAANSAGVQVLAAQHLDTNFVTTNEIRRDPNDNLIKAYDAFGPGLASFYNTFDIRANRTFTNAQTVQEPANDVISDLSSGGLNLASLDIVDFTITVERQG